MGLICENPIYCTVFQLTQFEASHIDYMKKHSDILYLYCSTQFKMKPLLVLGQKKKRAILCQGIWSDP